MFSNLKNKILEEVKSSQAFNSITQNSNSAPKSAASSDNFFSITEDDTPQNSPLSRESSRSSKADCSTTKVENYLNNGNNSVASTRIRKLSNSSMASDVSFRLPSYDLQIHYLQSDVEASASEVEDNASSFKLDITSKEHLYDAYRKALDRYQKYRGKFVDLARKYKDLERDSNKARSVLVETQDKAIRRISELREQCVLEQQAKAHLEEALRLEMDDMQCEINALNSKLRFTEEQNPSTNSNDASNNEQSELDLREKLAEYEKIIVDLKKREEENIILLAQNKQAIHLELDNRENEMKKLKLKLADSEQLNSQLTRDKQNLKKEVEEFIIVKERLRQITTSKQELEAKLISNDHLLKEARRELREKQDSANKNTEEIKQSYETKIDLIKSASNEKYEELSKLSKELELVNARIEALENENMILQDISKEYSNKEIEISKHQNELHAAKSQIAELENKLKNSEEIFRDLELLQKEIEETKNSHLELKREKQKLENEIESMADQKKIIEEAECKLKNVEREKLEIMKMNSLMEENSSRLETDISKQNELINKLQMKVSNQHEEINVSKESSNILKAKFDSLLKENSVLISERTQQDQDFSEKVNEIVLVRKDFENLQEEYENLTRENSNLNKVLNDLRTDLKETSEKLNTATKENETLKKEIDNMKHIQQKLTDSDKLNKNLKEELELKCSDYENIVREIENIKNNTGKENDESKLYKEIKSLTDSIKEKEQELFIKSELVKKLENAVQTSNTNINKLIEDAELKTNEIECLKSSLKEIQQQSNSELAVENKQLKTSNLQLENCLSEKKDEILSLDKRLRELQNIISQRDEIEQGLEKRNSELKIKLMDYEQSDSKLKRLLEENKSLIEIVGTQNTDDFSVGSETIENLFSQINNYQKRLDESYEVIKILESNISELKTNMKKSIDIEEEVNETQVVNELKGTKIKVDEPSENQNIQYGIVNEEFQKQNENEKLSQSSFDNLIKEKIELEDKLKDVFNRNLFLEQQCEQFLILEQSNTRLKSQNDKLNRQLSDVILNSHNQEGISANTEFEYLKNIMFQYLTGTMSDKNETLVKVIAAVLRFSPQQTQVVLEKEHQKGSLLSQLL